MRYHSLSNCLIQCGVLQVEALEPVVESLSASDVSNTDILGDVLSAKAIGEDIVQLSMSAPYGKKSLGISKSSAK